MTVVEFFDGVSIDNMASCLAIKPDKIIFIGDKKPMRKQEKAYLRFAESCGIKVAFDYKPIDRTSLKKIIEVLSEIAETEEDCLFDLTGGEDLILVAMGIVFEKYKNTRKIQMHRVNIKNGNIYDCDNDGISPKAEPPKITVKDNIMLYGGCVVPYNGEKGTYEWKFDIDFEADLKAMWDICKRNPHSWNLLIGTLGYMAKENDTDIRQLSFYADKNYTREAMKCQNLKFTWNKGIMDKFKKHGLITDLSDGDDVVSFIFKNEQIKLCLTKEGTVLELMTLRCAKMVKDDDGQSMYNDAISGVYIDWDAELHDISDEEKDTENEIDVILMDGLVPIFISCKNGRIDDAELYKLNTVAEKFGGPYAKKVLVTSYGGNRSEESKQSVRQRADDMNIKRIEMVHDISEEEFINKIKNITCN